ncbi:Putative 115 kDa protein in type-1 retrotransposable element R1DM [Eumeta japonica]|uniref:115 kDa protein in type-1 retrotransposable element R1DM n=1 Tax=Eumeta variegata TaxID=151549 RepID=A0A4C1XCD4_EUMVA|nr:Putative 115 kDa protein in type-1 retrotransposable element R1DM [Eumeta japonica]
MGCRNEWKGAVSLFSGRVGSAQYDWVKSDYESSQLLTGNGCFRRQLHDLVLNEMSECLWGPMYEDMHHVLWSFPLYDDIRLRVLSGLGVLHIGLVYYEDLVGTGANFRRFSEFARAWQGLHDKLHFYPTLNIPHIRQQCSSTDSPIRLGTTTDRCLYLPKHSHISTVAAGNGNESRRAAARHGRNAIGRRNSVKRVIYGLPNYSHHRGRPPTHADNTGCCKPSRRHVDSA